MSKKSDHQLIREAAEADLIKFIRLVAPHRVLGHIHEDLADWWGRSDAKSHQLVLLPRGHQKSQMIAYRVAWWITKHPEVTILYVSATSGLAEQQLEAVKAILESPIYRRYWPEMTKPSRSERARWNNSEIVVDHPKRIAEGVRDPTIKTAGVNSNIVGFHCDILVLDDLVTPDNAYTEENRRDVSTAYSFFASIENPEAKEWIVGTRYHPKDLYDELMKIEAEDYDEDGNVISSREVFEVFERAVEDRGDGTGEFLWPRTARADGKYFGFNRSVLATKRAQYLDKTQFRAQYYNDPNDPESARFSYDSFQYYDRGSLVRKDGKWTIGGRPLTVYASVDFAYSLRKTADYTAIVVIGIDSLSNIYILDIDRFRTDRISEYFDHIKALHIKWDFRKLRAEVVAAQSMIVSELKSQYLRPSGLALSIEEYRPTRHGGSKQDRILQILESRYDNQLIWHYRGGHCQTLEEELILAHPPHDDVKDALASVVEIAVPPRDARMMSSSVNTDSHNYNRFGGF